MTNWRSISDIVFELRRSLPRVPPGDDLRMRATRLLMAVYASSAAQAPPLINLAALTVSMERRVVVHRVSAGAARMVAETDLHSLPGEPPQLLRGPWIAEARTPERDSLFGATSAVAGYPLDESIFLVGLDYPDGAWVARWQPQWAERDLAAGIVEEDSPLIWVEPGQHREWARQAARFAVVLGMLLEAEGSPVAVDEEERPRRPRHICRGDRGIDDWVVRRVHLGRIVRSTSISPSQPSPGDVDPGGVVDTREEAVVPVRGHLKRQPYGPGRSLRRWIYIEGYEARRWVAPRPLRIEVRT